MMRAQLTTARKRAIAVALDHHRRVRDLVARTGRPQEYGNRDLAWYAERIGEPLAVTAALLDQLRDRGKVRVWFDVVSRRTWVDEVVEQREEVV